MALPDPTQDSTVVVTGASAGIGASIARELAARGHGVTLVARRRAALEALADELRAEHGVDVHVRVADLAKDRARARLVREVREGPAIAGLCNNAGTAAFGRVVDHDADEEDQMVRINVLALFDLTNRLVRDMVRRGAGAVLNTASILAFAPIPQNATYAASKAFIASYSEALHTELAGTGVSCTTVNPGPTRTGIWAQAGEPRAAGFGPGLLWHDADEVAREAVEAMARGRRSVTPGWTNKLAALGYRFAPRTALLPGMSAAQSEPVRRFLLGARDDEA
jgi:short-subunit dehydrogenase